MITDQQRKLIHLARRRINMTEPDYRAMLQRVAGVDTSNDLDAASFGAVMDELERLGFKTVGSAPQYGERLGMATPAQINKIRSLWRKYARTEEEGGMERFIEKHFGPASLRFLDAETAGKVIVTFENMAAWRKTRRKIKPAA